MDDVIAEKRLSILYPDGTPVPVILRLGVPRAIRPDEAACAVQAEGLRIWQGPKLLYGADTFQALLIAIRFLQKLLALEVERGAILREPEGTEPLGVPELFVLD